MALMRQNQKINSKWIGMQHRRTAEAFVDFSRKINVAPDWTTISFGKQKNFVCSRRHEIKSNAIQQWNGVMKNPRASIPNECKRPAQWLPLPLVNVESWHTKHTVPGHRSANQPVIDDHENARQHEIQCEKVYRTLDGRRTVQHSPAAVRFMFPFSVELRLLFILSNIPLRISFNQIIKKKAAKKRATEWGSRRVENESADANKFQTIWKCLDEGKASICEEFSFSSVRSRRRKTYLFICEIDSRCHSNGIDAFPRAFPIFPSAIVCVLLQLPAIAPERLMHRLLEDEKRKRKRKQ